MGYIVLVAAMLIARTFCDLWMIKNTTTIERIIISRNGKEFPKGILKLFIAMLPIACVNCLLKYGLQEMSLRFRTRLTAFLYGKYLKGFTYYKISNLDNRISNPDQLLTTDIEKFCQSIAVCCRLVPTTCSHPTFVRTLYTAYQQY
jgi:ATP-binding cassette, subfamily D (ALD), member 3